MEEQIELIKKWLGAGSINIFGLPMSGKDTVGQNLAKHLGAKFLSSGDIIRQMKEGLEKSANGQLIPSDLFYEWVLPYFERVELKDFSLVLSSIGRWSGEEQPVMSAASRGGHPIRAVVVLQISETEAVARWQTAQVLQDRGERLDDGDYDVFQKRLGEYREKTVPVLRHYQQLGMLIPVSAEGTREEVFANVIAELAKFANS